MTNLQKEYFQFKKKLIQITAALNKIIITIFISNQKV